MLKVPLNHIILLHTRLFHYDKISELDVVKKATLISPTYVLHINYS